MPEGKREVPVCRRAAANYVAFPGNDETSADGAGTMTEQRFDAGETIFREGDPADFAYLIHAGCVEIIKQTPDGTVRLACLGEGDMFGEMGLLDERPRSATARACGPVVASTIDQSAFLNMLVCRPRDSLAVLRAVFERLRSMNRWVAELASPHAAGPWIAQVALRALAPHADERAPGDGAAGDGAAGVNGAAPGDEAAGRLILEVGPEGVSVRGPGGASGTLVNGTAIGNRAAAALHPGANEVVAFGAGAPARYRIVIEVVDERADAIATRH